MTDKALDVAVDNGHAQQKIAFWDGDLIKTITLPSRAELGAVNISLDGKVEGVYTVDGTDYTVGEHVTEPVKIRSQGYAFSEVNAALVYNSLSAAGFSGKSVRLATGLPFDYYFKNGQKDEAFLEKVKNGLRREIVCRTEPGQEASVSEHLIYPESTAAFVDYALDVETMDFKPVRNGLVVVDMGGETTDITVITPNNTINIDLSGSQHIGVLFIRDRLQSLITTQYNVQKLLDSQLDEALKTNSIFIWGEEKDVSELVESAKRLTAKKLSAYIDEKIGDAGYMDKILFVGGGANILGGYLKDERPNIFIPHEPENANARGMLKYMSLIQG